MEIFQATMIAEGVDDADEETQIEAWQTLVDTGVVWQLQGYFGRMARRMIDEGLLLPYPRVPRANTH